MNRGHTIDPRRKVLLQAANTLAATRRYRNQLVQLRAEAKARMTLIDRLIERITEKLEQDANV